MAIYPCTQMATRIYNQHSYLYRTGYIRTSTLLGFCLTSCGLVSHSWKFWPIIRLTDTSWDVIWSLRLCSLAESWYFKGMTIWVTSFPAISADAFLFFGGTRCERLKSLVSRLKYTQHLNNSTINTFVNARCRTRLPLRVFFMCVFVCHVTLDIFRLLCSVLSLVRTLLATEQFDKLAFLWLRPSFFLSF